MNGGLGIAEVRTQLEGLLTDLITIGEARGSTDLAVGASRLAAKLDEQRFLVAVVGEFKRGKSSFINALLGAEVLPVGAIPVTSVVTVATYGPVPTVEVGFGNGTTEVTDLESLASFVTERENPGNVRGVTQVTVEHPAAPLAEGVRLVDTPGVGSIHQHNTQTTRQFLAEVDAAVFVTSADQPVSHAERLFLEEVSDHAAGMFFVLNKVDILQPDDVDEVVDFTSRALSEATGRPVVVYPVSALGALRAKQHGDTTTTGSSHMARFERDFGAFLMDEKADVLTRSVAGRAERLIAEETNTVRVERETMRLTVEEATLLISRLKEVAEHATASRRDLETLLEMETRQIMKTIEADLEALRTVETARLLAEAHSLLDAHPNPRSAAADLDEAIKESLRRSIDAWRQAEDLKVAELFGAATTRFCDETATLVQTTTRLCSELFDVDLTAPPEGDRFDVESEFTFAFFDPSDEIQMAIEAIRRRTPRAIARMMLAQKLAEDIPILVDKHCGRLRWDYSQGLDRVRTRLTGELAGRLDRTLDSLRRGVERARSRRLVSESEATTARAELDEALRSLGAAADRLVELTGVTPRRNLTDRTSDTSEN